VKHFGELLKDFRNNEGLDKTEEKKIFQYEEIMGYRDFVPTLTFLVSEAINEVATDQKLMSPEGRSRLMKIERPKRRVIIVDSMDMQKYRDDLSSIDVEALKDGYSGASVTRESGNRGTGTSDDGERGGVRRPSISNASISGQTSFGTRSNGQRGYLVYLAGSTPLPYGEAAQFLGELRNKLGELASAKVRNKLGELVAAFPSIEVSNISVIVEIKRGQPLAAPSETGNTPRSTGWTEEGGGRTTGESSVSGNDGPDSLTGENTSADTQFVLGWKVAIKDNGLPKDDQADSASKKAGGAK